MRSWWANGPSRDEWTIPSPAPDAFGLVILRRARGYAPSVVTTIPIAKPILATGADLKNSVTLVVNGQAMMSQHIGDLDQYESLEAFRETIDDLTSMYEVPRQDLIVAYDAHPQYLSSIHALELSGAASYAIQHHRAHVASVLAERAAWEKRVLGVSFDGTGYGDDGSIWGGEFFVGSIVDGFDRVAHLRPAALAGGTLPPAIPSKPPPDSSRSSTTYPISAQIPSISQNATRNHWN